MYSHKWDTCVTLSPICSRNIVEKGAEKLSMLKWVYDSDTMAYLHRRALRVMTACTSGLLTKPSIER